MSIFSRAGWPALALLACGCAADPYDTSKPVSKDSTITVATPIRYAVGDSAPVVEYEIANGTYSATREDGQGVYYVGPQGCLTSKMTKGNWATSDKLLGKRMASDCGVYIPTDPAAPARLFIVFHGQQSSWEVGHEARQAANATVPGASIGQAALGSAIGVGIANHIVDSADGKYMWVVSQPKGLPIREHLAR